MDSSQQQSSLEAPGAIHEHNLAPPSSGVFATFKEAEEALQKHAISSGYGVNRQRSKNKEGEFLGCYFKCSRSGEPRPSETQNRKRNHTSTRCIGCPFSVHIGFKKSLDQWTLRVRDGRHNHGAVGLESLPEDRMRMTRQFESEIKAKTQMAARLELLQHAYASNILRLQRAFFGETF